MTKLTNEELLAGYVGKVASNVQVDSDSMEEEIDELRAEILKRMAEGAAGEASSQQKSVDKLAEALKIRTWDQGDDGFGGEWVTDPTKEEAIRAFWKSAYTAGAEAEKVNRIGWQNRAADAEQKLYRSETPAPEDVQLDVELEKRIAEIRKRLSKVAEGPWFTSSDDASDSPDHKDSGLAMVDTGRSSEWPIARLCEWQNARFIGHAILDIPFLLEQLALLRRVSAPEVVFEFSPSPCGHSSQYAYTEDGGKNIVCLVCERRVSGKGAQGPLTIADYEEVFADHRRLVRELDVLLNGEAGAAKQASLCDIVAQVKNSKLIVATTQGTPEGAK